MSDDGAHDECYSKGQLDDAVDEYRRFLIRVRKGWLKWAEASGHPVGHCKCDVCKPWLTFHELFPDIKD